jgi:ElaB/YqjD/DUF883 family membrane-anchored ribosome-binding protein
MTEQSMPGATETRKAGQTQNGAGETAPNDTANAQNAAAAAMQDAATKVQDAAAKVGAQASEIGGQVYQKAVDAGQYANRQLEEQPWVAAAAVGLIGLMIGIMLGRASVPAPRTARDYVDDYLPRRLRRD